GSLWARVAHGYQLLRLTLERKGLIIRQLSSNTGKTSWETVRRPGWHQPLFETRWAGRVNGAVFIRAGCPMAAERVSIFSCYGSGGPRRRVLTSRSGGEGE